MTPYRTVSGAWSSPSVLASSGRSSSCVSAGSVRIVCTHVSKKYSIGVPTPLSISGSPSIPHKRSRTMSHPPIRLLSALRKNTSSLAIRSACEGPPSHLNALGSMTPYVISSPSSRRLIPSPTLRACRRRPTLTCPCTCPYHSR